MSLKKNVVASYVGQIYTTLIGIVMIPVYVKYMGIEAYGLVGFYGMLQGWFQLLDIGLTPAMARETARFQGGTITAFSLRQLLRTLEGIFIVIAMLGALAIITSSNYITNSWLQVQKLSLMEVRDAIILMAIIVALRWVCGLYRSVINGFEKLVWLNVFSSLIASIRFIGIIPFFIYISSSPKHFFLFQLIVALVEMLLLSKKAYWLMPKVENKKLIPWSFTSLHSIGRFSLSVALSSIVWILLTQTDKLILSKLLTLTEYASFTLVPNF